MKRKISIFLSIFIIIVMLLTIKSNAGYSSNDPEAISNGTVTITVSSSESLQNYDLKLTSYAGLTYVGCSKAGEAGEIVEVNNQLGNISYISTGVGTKVLGTYTFKVPTVTEETTYKVTFDINGVKNTSTVTVKPEQVQTQPPETTPEPEPTTPDTPPAVTEKSSNANIKMIETSPVDFSGFKKDKFSGYEVNVENDVDKIYVNVTKEDSKASISLLNKTNSDTGKSWVYIKEGSNEIDVTITAEDGTTKKTYTISVIRAEKEEEEEPEEKPEEPEEDPMEEVFGLSEIKIEGVELKPEFKTDVYEYKVKVEDLDKLKITTLATEANSNIEILGNDNLKEGENVITIVVKSKDEEKNATYQITVIKSVKAVVDTENVTNEVAGVTEEPAIEKDNTNKMMIIIIAVLVVIAIIIIAIVINSRKNRSFYELDEDEEDDEQQYEDNSFENLYDDNKEKINATNANDQFFEEVKKSKGKRFK